MESRPREIRLYERENGRVPFDDWILTIKDHKIRGIILRRLDRVEAGNFGDCEPVGEGIFELRVNYGPGYRVYFGEDGDLVVLLHGGDKSSQGKDIKIAKDFWRDYNA